MKRILLFFPTLFLIISCSTRKEIVYFQNEERLNNIKASSNFEPVFEVNDILHIKVSSINPDVVAPFQMDAGNQTQGGGNQQNPALNGYLVDIDGNIQFPVLGKVNVVGKSRSELELFLTSELSKYVTDVVVAVRLINFRVIVLGEAGSETVVKVENEKMSIPELFASVGGISYNGKRNDIMVIREINGVRSVGHVDMTSSNVFKNPYYYLKQNDIVYVEPTYKQVKSAGFITSYTGLISIGTTIFSLIVLFTR